MGFQSKTKYLERADYSWGDDSIRHINTPSVSTRQLFFYVQEAGYFKTFPPYFTERANLHSFLIVYTISGRGQLRINGETFPLPAGSCFYINYKYSQSLFWFKLYILAYYRQWSGLDKYNWCISINSFFYIFICRRFYE